MCAQLTRDLFAIAKFLFMFQTTGLATFSEKRESAKTDKRWIHEDLKQRESDRFIHRPTNITPEHCSLSIGEKPTAKDNRHCSLIVGNSWLIPKGTETRNHKNITACMRLLSFLSASLYFSKRGAYWDRLCRDVVGRWLVVTRVHCGQTVHPRPIVTMEH